MLLPVSQSDLDFVQHVGFFEVVGGCNFYFPQAYLKLRCTVEVDCNSDGNVGWFSYSVGNQVVFDIPAREVLELKPSLDDEAISAYVYTVKVSVLVDHLFSLFNARDATTASLSPFEEVEEKELRDGEDDFESVSDASELHRSSARCPWVLERV